MFLMLPGRHALLVVILIILLLIAGREKKKITDIPISDVRNRSVNYRPQNPCSHCGSKWHSIYVCSDYHKVYYDNYEVLPKFNKSTFSDSHSNSSHMHANVNKKNVKSTTDRANTDKVKNVRVTLEEVGSKHKTSAVKVNKNIVKRIQQVWVLKNSN